VNIDPTPAPSAPLPTFTSLTDSKITPALDTNDIIGISIGVPSFLATLAGVILLIMPKLRQKVKQLFKRNKGLPNKGITTNGIVMSPPISIPAGTANRRISPPIADESIVTVQLVNGQTHAEFPNQKPVAQERSILPNYPMEGEMTIL